MYKALIFDLDNTLLDYDCCELDSMKRAIRQHGIFEGEGPVWDSFWRTFLKHNLFYWEERFSRKLTGLEVIELALRDTLEPMGAARLAGDVSRSYWAAFCHTCHFEEGAPEVLRWARQHYKLGIISNGTGEAQHTRLESGGIYSYFDAIIVSDEVGYWKPDPNIFAAALKKLHMQRHEVLYIGDSLRDDYAGALNAGVDFCFYNRKAQAIEKPADAKYMINKLPELLQLLETKGAARIDH